ncbi:MAG: DCC1-like thiol-disulfide oxidoreductase family protein [Chitinophagaceae bacterium]
MSQLILFFDGECNLCNGAVSFVIKHNKAANILFASLQSKAGKDATDKVSAAFGRVPDSLFFLENGRYFTESSAALQLAKHLDFPWSWVQYFRFVPRIIRDGVYRFVSRNRFKWFGKRSSCMMPTPELKARFLD